MTELIKALDLHDRRGIREGEMVISGSLRNRRRRRAVQPPPCSLNVGGPITPNIKGCYVFAGYLNGRQYYKHRTMNGYIFYFAASEPASYIWILSTSLTPFAGTYWTKVTGSYESELGDYNPFGGAAGVAKVNNP